jgi:hypothetical protein
MEGSYSRIVQRLEARRILHRCCTQIFQEQLGLRKTLLVDYSLLVRVVFMHLVKLEIEISKEQYIITRVVPFLDIEFLPPEVPGWSWTSRYPCHAFLFDIVPLAK